MSEYMRNRSRSRSRGRDAGRRRDASPRRSSRDRVSAPGGDDRGDRHTYGDRPQGKWLPRDDRDNRGGYGGDLSFKELLPEEQRVLWDDVGVDGAFRVHRFVERLNAPLVNVWARSPSPPKGKQASAGGQAKEKDQGKVAPAVGAADDHEDAVPMRAPTLTVDAKAGDRDSSDSSSVSSSGSSSDSSSASSSSEDRSRRRKKRSSSKRKHKTSSRKHKSSSRKHKHKSSSSRKHKRSSRKHKRSASPSPSSSSSSSASEGDKPTDGHKHSDAESIPDEFIKPKAEGAGAGV